MNLPSVFVDTWGWMALGHRRDPQHIEVRDFYRHWREEQIPITTSDYVLDELVTLLFRRESFSEAVRFVEGLLDAAEEGHLVVKRVTPKDFSAAWDLRKRFQDKPDISFTDLTSMVLMKDLGISQVLTGDKHFIQVGMGFSRLP